MHIWDWSVPPELDILVCFLNPQICGTLIAVLSACTLRCQIDFSYKS